MSALCFLVTLFYDYISMKQSNNSYFTLESYQGTVSMSHPLALFILF
jgi:hypothetical protein